MDPEFEKAEFEKGLSFIKAMATVVRYRGADSAGDVAILAGLGDELSSKRVECPKCKEFICPYGNT